jgi:hypothetical protein
MLFIKNFMSNLGLKRFGRSMNCQADVIICKKTISSESTTNRVLQVEFFSSTSSILDKQ